MLGPKGAVTIDYGELEPYTPPAGASIAYLFDLDGTLCTRGDRDPYDETKVLCDTVNESVRRVLWALANTGNTMVAMSGRSEKCRDDTEAWLRQHYKLRYHALFMRPSGDVRPDWRIKYELFNKHIRDRYHVAGVFDDRNQVVGMWRAIGLTVFQVADGPF
jgi:hypothetical protein